MVCGAVKRTKQANKKEDEKPPMKGRSVQSPGYIRSRLIVFPSLKCTLEKRTAGIVPISIFPTTCRLAFVPFVANPRQFDVEG